MGTMPADSGTNKLAELNPKPRLCLVYIRLSVIVMTYIKHAVFSLKARLQDFILSNDLTVENKIVHKQAVMLNNFPGEMLLVTCFVFLLKKADKPE